MKCRMYGRPGRALLAALVVALPTTLSAGPARAAETPTPYRPPGVSPGTADATAPSNTPASADLSEPRLLPRSQQPYQPGPTSTAGAASPTSALDQRGAQVVRHAAAPHVAPTPIPPGAGDSSENSGASGSTLKISAPEAELVPDDAGSGDVRVSDAASAQPPPTDTEGPRPTLAPTPDAALGPSDVGQATLSPTTPSGGIQPAPAATPVEPAVVPTPVEPAPAAGTGALVTAAAAEGAPVAGTDPTPSPSAESPEEAPLRPVPMADPSAPVSVEPASFKGVTPGLTTLEEVRQAWGPPKELANQGGFVRHVYAVEPFDRVEVTFSQNKVSAIVIRLARSFPADTVAKQLELANIRPVLVADEMGALLGQAYPERGVLFSFEPSEDPQQPEMKVNQIILEPIGPESFLLRAETDLSTQYESSLRDLDQVLKLDPANAKGHWLRARVLVSMDRRDEALAAATQAVKLDGENARYRLVRAQVLEQLGRIDEAVEDVRKAAQVSSKRPHVKARAMCLLGDLLASGAKRDYKQAMDYHMLAVQIADPLAKNEHPAIRLAAKQVLVDAYLGAANDIAWGYWKQKEAAVPKWVERAQGFADDLIKNEGENPEHRLRVAIRALSAYVGVQGQLDPQPWIDVTLSVGGELIDAADDPARKQQLQWDVGMALYDALQIYQMRGDHDEALKRGQQAIEYLEKGGVSKHDTPQYTYLMGRLYFRLGAIYAVRDQNHKAAVAWFDKAVPHLEKPVPRALAHDVGRLGETFVSMGVSYWEAGQKDKGVALTLRGVELMKKAIQAGTLNESTLAIPFSNLATMYQQLGKEDEAKRYLQMANTTSNTKVE